MKEISRSVACVAIMFLLAASVLAKDQSGDSVRAIIDDLMSRAVNHHLGSTPADQDSMLWLSDSAETLARFYLGTQDSSEAMALALRAFTALTRYEDNRADSFATQSIRCWQTIKGKECPQQAYPLRILAESYFGRNREVEGENAAARAIKLLRAAPEYRGYKDIVRMPHFLALLINNYGSLFLGRGNLEEAERLYLEAKGIWSSAYGADSPGAAVGAFNLARVARARRDFVTAEKLARMALRVYEQTPAREKIWPTDVPETQVLLSEIYYDMGKTDEANKLTEQAIAGYVQACGKSTPGTLVAVEWAIYSYEIQHDWPMATKYAEEQIQVLEQFGILNPAGRSKAYLSLARNSWRLGDLNRALVAFDTSLALRQSFINGAFAFASESVKLRYLKEFPLIYESLLSLVLSSRGKQATDCALQMVLAGKGTIVDALSQERQTALCSDRADLQAAVLRHASVCDSIASLAMSGPEIANRFMTSRLKRLYSIKDSLELVLSQQCAEFDENKHADTVTIANVANALEPRSVLWEFLRYEPYDFSHSVSGVVPRYLALSLDPSNRVTITDLGDAATIDSLVNLVHQKVQAGVDVFAGVDERQLERDLASVSSRLAALLFAPLAHTVSDSDHIFISPDGQLSLLPFEVLSLPNGHYAVEDYEFSYLSSGRDLLRFHHSPASQATGALVFAGPDYESAGQPVYAQTNVSGLDVGQMRGPSDRTECLAVPYSPLPSALMEGQAVVNLLRTQQNEPVSILSGAAASEDSLKHQSKAPRILHIATHGYFCSKADYCDVSQMTESPLLYSGLLLAGCNRSIRGQDNSTSKQQDGILTALEVSGLNLQGTDLVVLSACQTGLGEVATGEGVYGLRRAFQLAGARSIVMSMFSVPDKTATDLMTNFYTNWLSGRSKSESMRNAQLSALRERRQQRGAAHPLFWGGFIVTGSP